MRILVDNGYNFPSLPLFFSLAITSKYFLSVVSISICYICSSGKAKDWIWRSLRQTRSRKDKIGFSYVRLGPLIELASIFSSR